MTQDDNETLKTFPEGYAAEPSIVGPGNLTLPEPNPEKPQAPISTSVAAALSNLSGISADLDAQEEEARAKAALLSDRKRRLDAAKELLAQAVNEIMDLKKEMGL